MTTLKFRETPLISQIFDYYVRIRPSASVHDSIDLKTDLQQDWGYTLGFSHKQGYISGLEYPQAGALQDLSRVLAEQNQANLPAVQHDIGYFNFVYNTCYQYINDNQSRYIGRANLTDISHAKVFAMTLIANLCKKGVAAGDPKLRDEYRQRIHAFTQQLLTINDIQSTRNNVDDLLSCKSSLNRIFNANIPHNPADEQGISAFYAKVSAAVFKMDRALGAVNHYTFSLITEQSTIAFDHWEQLSVEGNTTLNEVESELTKRGSVLELYLQPQTILNHENGYKQLYNNIDYRCNQYDSFLLSQFDTQERQTMKQLLQSRDKLQVLTIELSKLLAFAQKNAIANFNDFLKLLDPYLKETHQLHKQLRYDLVKFDGDCGTVYRNPLARSGFNSKRKNWEKAYLNKEALTAVRLQMQGLYQAVSEVFASIPLDYFTSLETFSEDAKEIKERAEFLFGKDFLGADSNFQKAITLAQQHELARQADLVLARQKNIAAEYADLIVKAKNSDDNTLTQLLICRKEAVDQLIEALTHDAQDLAKEEGFVLIEYNPISANLMELENTSDGFFQLVRGYLDAPSKAQLKALQEENNSLTLENSALREIKSGLEAYIVGNDAAFHNMQLTLNASEQEKATLRETLEVNDQLLLSPFLSIERKRALNSVPLERRRALQSLLVNVDHIVAQGMLFKNAYTQYAGQYDRTLFFSHNQNGKKHASGVMGQWRSLINRAVQTESERFLADEAYSSADLTANLNALVKNSIDNLVINEQYSSYKKHSFRNYLRHFHQTVLSGPDKTVNLAGEIKRVAAVEIPALLNSDFNSAVLEAFELNVENLASPSYVYRV